MTDIYEPMLRRHNLDTADARRTAQYEVMQQIILGGLYRGGFFEKAAFYGGTCLRIFHGLKRYSEDMDFSLMKKDDSFNLENYFQSIVEEAKLLGSLKKNSPLLILMLLRMMFFRLSLILKNLKSGLMIISCK